MIIIINTFFSNLQLQKFWYSKKYFDDLTKSVDTQNINSTNSNGISTFELPIPNNPEDFCICVYGQDYLNIFYVNTPHEPILLSNIIDLLGIYLCTGTKYYIKDLK